MLPGLLITLAGLSLAIAPLVAARGADRLRFDPADRTAWTVVSYRASGVALAALGCIVAGLGRY